MTTWQQLRDAILPHVWKHQQSIESPLIRVVDIGLDDDKLMLVIDGTKTLLLTKDEFENGQYEDLYKSRMKEALGGES